jgi:cell surface protein SprA
MNNPVNTATSRTVTRPSFIIGSEIIPKLAKPNTTNIDLKNKEISDSFEQNVVNFPFPNWSLVLTGAEKFDLFAMFASTMSIENAYTSDYKRVFTYTGFKPEYISQHSITSSFSPLIGVNVTFKQIEGGILTASFKLNKTNNFDLTTNDARVTHTSTSDLSINASYSKQGFNIPLFGLSLKNDLSISFSLTRTKNEPKTLNYSNGIWNTTPQTGTISLSINPSIQYALSRSVTIQLFYKYTKTEPIEGINQVTTRNNEAGLNLKLSIQ